MGLEHLLSPAPTSEATKRYLQAEKAAHAQELNSVLTHQGKTWRQTRAQQEAPQFSEHAGAGPKPTLRPFTNYAGVEGFVGDTTIKTKNTQEQSTMTYLTSLMQNKLQAFSNAQTTFMQAVSRFLGTQSGSNKRVNYNVYTSRGANVDELPVKTEGCFTLPSGGASNVLQRQDDMGSGVSLIDCKRRAVDKGTSLYGVTAKNGDCYVGTDINAVKNSAGPGLQMKTSLVLTEMSGANQAGMLLNGQVNIFDGDNADTTNSVSAVYQGAAACDPKLGGKVKITAATYGANCANPVTTSTAGATPTWKQYGTTSAVGGPGGTAKSLICPEGSFVRSVNGLSGGVMDSFGITCSDGTTKDRVGGSGGSYTYTVSNYDGFKKVEVNAGAGRYGNVVNSMKFFKPDGSLDNSTGNPTSFDSTKTTLDCTEGKIMGFNLKTSNFIDNVQLVCGKLQ